MGMDREDTHELGRWEERKGELRAELVDKRKLAHDTFPGLRVDGLGVPMQVLGNRAEGLGQLCVVGDAPEKQETGKKTIPQVKEFFEEFKGCSGIFFWLRSKKECECTGPERIVPLI